MYSMRFRFRVLNVSTKILNLPGHPPITAIVMKDTTE